MVTTSGDTDNRPWHVRMVWHEAWSRWKWLALSTGTQQHSRLAFLANACTDVKFCWRRKPQDGWVYSVMWKQDRSRTQGTRRLTVEYDMNGKEEVNAADMTEWKKRYPVAHCEDVQPVSLGSNSLSAFTDSSSSWPLCLSTPSISHRTTSSVSCDTLYLRYL